MARTPTTATQTAALGIVVNLVLAAVKIATGLAGNSYALIGDGIESTTDVITSLIVWGGLRISASPPDENHPFGHGKAESLAAVIAAFGLLAAAAVIAVQSIHEILEPHKTPAWFTLPVLLGVILTKELLSRYALRVSDELGSTSLQVDAWHHRSDALTSAAVVIGITVALIGGPGYEAADDWAALLACGVIAFNGIFLLRTALREVMDAAVAAELLDRIREVAMQVPGVGAIEKCRVRKSGLGFLMDIHVQVDGNLTVTAGHEIGHRVKDRLLAANLKIQDVVVHIEPLPAA
ncbi:MAG TPA: cation diffusion facilitator family transporter [Gemmataceae bacterium]|nr:cation diffusion facilitator family transporter [Gemmataceae bacterium]